MHKFILKENYLNKFLRCESADANSYSRLIMKPENSLPDAVVSLARLLIIILAVFNEILFDGVSRDFDISTSTTMLLTFESADLSRNRLSSFSSNYK